MIGCFICSDVLISSRNLKFQGFLKSKDVVLLVCLPFVLCLLSRSSAVYLRFKAFHWTHEMPPDQKRPLDTYYDSDRGRLASYQLEVRLQGPVSGKSQ